MIEDAIGAAVAAQVGPLALELRRLTGEVAELRRHLPAPLVTIEEYAEQSHTSISTVRRAIKRGDLPIRRIGRSVRVDLAALRPMTDDEVSAAARAARGQR